MSVKINLNKKETLMFYSNPCSLNTKRVYLI